jgi:hypothetical protein
MARLGSSPLAPASVTVAPSRVSDPGYLPESLHYDELIATWLKT